MREYQVPEKYEEVRMDRYLRKTYPQLKLSEIFKALRTGKIKVNGKKVKEDYRLQAKDIIQNYFSFAKEEVAEKNFLFLSEKEKKALEAQIYYEDEDMLVYWKKVGELMHKGSGHDYGLAELFQAYFQNEDFHFVNRLDRDTSGLVLAGKNLKTVRMLTELIREKALIKKYYILVEGIPEKEEFHLQSFLKKGERKMEVQESRAGALECKASFRLLESYAKESLLEADLETGRTHQLRVQLSSIGHSILGDLRYGKRRAERLYLHSHRLEIPSLEKVWETGIPEDFLLYFKNKKGRK